MTASPRSTEVTIQDLSFGPKAVNARVGDVVSFTNTDDQPHTATADDRSFDTGSIAAGASMSVTVTKPGTYTYHCSFHPFMTATVTAQ